MAPEPPSLSHAVQSFETFDIPRPCRDNRPASLAGSLFLGGFVLLHHGMIVACSESPPGVSGWAFRKEVNQMYDFMEVFLDFCLTLLHLLKALKVT